MSGKPQSHSRRLTTLMSRVTPGWGGCWLWTGFRYANGYGLFALDGRKVYAHRAAYELTVGPIPDGLHIDHLCRVRACIRPDHLEAVPQAENNNRACAIRTHCRHGHLLDGRKQRGGKTARYCKTCNRLREQGKRGKQS